MHTQIPLLDDANYDLESNDSRKVLSRCRIKLRDFFTNLRKVKKKIDG